MILTISEQPNHTCIQKATNS